jgi:hypothetical protein
MHEKSVCSCHRLFTKLTKLEVSKRLKRTDLSLNLQGGVCSEYVFMALSTC